MMRLLTVATLLAPLSHAQPASSSGNEGLTDMVHAEEQAEKYANETVGKLVAFTDNLRSLSSSPSWSNDQAQSIQSHAEATISAARSASQADRVDTLHALVSVSIKELNLDLNETQFGALRSTRTTLIGSLDAADEKLGGLTATYKNQLMKAEICADEKSRMAQAQELQNDAQAAASDLSIMVGVGDKLPDLAEASRHQEIEKRSAQFNDRIASESDAAAKIIQSLPGMIMSNIEGLSGGCDDAAQFKDKQEQQKTIALMEVPGVQSNNIDNLKNLQDQATSNAKGAVDKLKAYLEALNQKDFSAAAATARATAILKATAADFAKRRSAIVADLEQNVQTASQFANDPNNEKYTAAIAATDKGLADLKQLGAGESDDEASKTAATAEEDADKARILELTGSIKAHAQSMLDYESALGQMQATAGVNASDIDARKQSVDALSSRMVQASEDAGGIADLILGNFHTAVLKNVVDNAAKSQLRLFLGSRTHVDQAVSGTTILAGAFFAGLAVTASLLLSKVRQRTAVIDPMPLLA